MLRGLLLSWLAALVGHHIYSGKAVFSWPGLNSTMTICS